MSCDKEAEPLGPTADFTYTANYLIVSFGDVSTVGDGEINSWNWDFGDGKTDWQNLKYPWGLAYDKTITKEKVETRN